MRETLPNNVELKMWVIKNCKKTSWLQRIAPKLALFQTPILYMNITKGEESELENFPLSVISTKNRH